MHTSPPLNLVKLFTGTEGNILVVMKVRCSTLKKLPAKLILVIPVTLRPTALFKAKVAVTQFLDAWAATVVVKNILDD